MANDIRTELAQQALQFVEIFFNDLIQKEETYLPECFRSYGRWTANYTGSVLGIYFMSEAELKRVAEHKKNGWPPFPGFLISQKLKPPHDASALLMSGTCNYFASNRTVNMWAFTVKPGASFTVVNHFHEVKDSSTDQTFTFHVDLAFVIGLHQEKQWTDLEPKLSELLSHTVEVWKKI